MPLGDVATVRSIECNSQPCAIARAGDNVSVVLQGIDVNHVIAGGVLCHPDYPIRVASRMELKILVLDVKVPILIGSQVRIYSRILCFAQLQHYHKNVMAANSKVYNMQLEFHIHHAKEAARVVKIVSLLDPKTGKETKKAPRCLVAKQNAVIEVQFCNSVLVSSSYHSFQ